MLFKKIWSSTAVLWYLVLRYPILLVLLIHSMDHHLYPLAHKVHL